MQEWEKQDNIHSNNVVMKKSYTLFPLAWNTLVHLLRLLKTKLRRFFRLTGRFGKMRNINGAFD